MQSFRRRIQSSRKSSEETLPFTTAPPAAGSSTATIKYPHNNVRGGCCRSPLRLLAAFLAALIMILWFAEQLLVLLCVPSLPKLSTEDTAAAGPDDARVAVVSLHKGFKYHGPLGSWLSKNKRFYAERHGYAYIDESLYPESENLLPALDTPWQSQNGREVYYEKPRFLLYLMQRYPGIRYLLWIDGDALFTRYDISIEERVKLFTEMHHDTEPCLVWANDWTPNAGVLLLANTPTTRELLQTSLQTHSDDDFFVKFTDQASLTTAVKANATYTSCTLLLLNKRGGGNEDMTLLQSRLRAWGLWKASHWILHLPNHNWLELLQSLRRIKPSVQFNGPAP